jgi:1,2-diacylglycerol 3-alpha-glucosyltransferase
MNIGIITPTYVPDLNGISLSLEALVNGLQEKGNSVSIATPKSINRVRTEGMLDMPVFPLSNLFKPVLGDASIPYRFRANVSKGFKERRVQIVHSHDSGLLLNSSAKIARELGVPHVHTFHVMMEEYLQVLHPIGYKKIARRIALNACNKSDLVITPTKKIENYLKNIGVKTPIKTLLNIPNIDHLETETFNKEFANTLGIAESDFVFLSFGRLVKQKNIDLSLKYLAPILQRNKDIKFIIAGHGPELGKLRRLSKVLNIDSQVIFTGKYDKKSLNKLGSISDCFIITSRSETQCLTILEAMKMGLPVIASNDEVYNYILKDNYNGFFLEDSKITMSAFKLYRDREFLKKLSIQAYKSAEDLVSRDFSLEYIEVYKQAIKR